MASATPTIGTKTGRSRRRFHQLWQVPTFFLGLLAFLCAAASAPWRPTPQRAAFEQHLAHLRQGLAQGTSGDTLVGQADNLLLELPLFPSRAGEAHFLVGSAYTRYAQQKPAPLNKEIWPRAVGYLEKALEHGVPDADRFALRYRLGLALYQGNKDLPRSIELMTLAVEGGADPPLEGHRILLEANLRLATPNVDAALSASSRILELTSVHDADALARARLQHAELLVRKGLRLEAITELERIGTKASRPIQAKARFLHARTCEEEGRFERAVSLWQELVKESVHVEGGKALVQYRLGWCLHHLKNYPESIRAWADALTLGGPPGQAAGLHLGELRLSMMSEPEAAQALVDWKKALEKVRSPADFKNPHIELAQVRDILDNALKHFQEAQEPEKMQLIAELYRKVTSGGEAEKRVAEAAEAYAQQLALKLKDKQENVTAEQVQAQYRSAGDALDAAAKVRGDNERSDYVWRSAQCYRAAKDNALALQMLQLFVQITKNEARLAEGWFALGDLYQADGKKEPAQKAFLKCIEYPNTPFGYRARYFLAVEEIDKQNYDKARMILDQILQSSDDYVDRAAHEKSLYKMAWLLMQLKTYPEALVYLKDCVRLYPENQSALRAREQLGECYRRLAEKELAKEAELRMMIKPGIPEERRSQLEETLRHHRQARLQQLRDAVKTYQGLADELAQAGRDRKINSLEETLLRRSLLGIGECHLDAEEFDESLRAFQTLQVKHRRTLEGFHACYWLCHVVDKMPPPPRDAYKIKEMAMESLRLAVEDLKALPADHEMFKSPPVPTRDWWLRWSEAAQIRLLSPPKKEAPAPAFR